MDRPAERALSVSGSLIVASAMVVMNVASYAFTMLVARKLGPTGYGAFAALMALVLVVNVVSVGLQTTAARRVAVSPHARSRTVAEIERVSWRAAALLVALCVGLTPVISSALRLDSAIAAALLAVPAAAFAVMGGQAGLLQGEERWAGFAAIFASFGLARLLIGTAVMALIVSPTGAMLGVAIASVVPVLVGGWYLHGRSRNEDEPTPYPRSSEWGVSVWREVVNNTHALFAFFALSGVDVFVARLVLSENEAGLYAAGLILTKSVLFLPYFVIVVAFPAMSRQGASGRLHLWGLAAVGAMGLLVVAGTWLMPSLALVFIGGAAYTELQPDLWLFALLGTVLAAIQLLVHTALARRHKGAVWCIWTAFAVVAAGLTVVDTGAQLLTLVLMVNTALLAILTVVTRNDSVETARIANGQ